MLDAIRAFSGFAVDDIDAARGFYRDVIGVPVEDSGNGLLRLTLPGGDAQVVVYPRADHVPATYTILNIAVADVDVAVDALAASGVDTIRYDGYGQDDKGIMRGRGPDIAWFHDPAGNILSVIADASM
jgi:predicted enzyme related to lactoylglutathione lyase